jgi:hypothetical protein
MRATWGAAGRQMRPVLWTTLPCGRLLITSRTACAFWQPAIAASVYLHLLLLLRCCCFCCCSAGAALQQAHACHTLDEGACSSVRNLASLAFSCPKWYSVA